MRRIWLGVWVAAVAAVVVGSLAPGAVVSRVPTPVTDVLAHGVAYFVLGVLPGLVLGSARGRVAAAVGTVALGGVLEWAQVVVPGRSVEVLDFAANGVGVLAGWVMVEVGRMPFLAAEERR